MIPPTKLEQLRELAMDQYGLVTAEQALPEGLSHANLSMMISRGRLTRVAHGVYRVPQVAETSRDEYQLAVFWTDSSEVFLSHETALGIRNISDVNPEKIHLTVPRLRRIRRNGGGCYVIHHENIAPATSSGGKASRRSMSPLQSANASNPASPLTSSSRRCSRLVRRAH